MIYSDVKTAFYLKDIGDVLFTWKSLQSKGLVSKLLNIYSGKNASC